MEDLARLQIRVESVEAALAEQRLDKLERTGKKTEKATDGLRAGFSRLVGPLLATVSAVGGLNKLVDVTREFEVLNAQLITATGSAENAGVAFEAIQDFASNTPYDLQQVTKAFTQLVNLGLTPSEKALTSYGNTASAMGKDLSQMIEAVADASTGEFERLKEFGIRASKEGDQVKFTFRGVTETVAFESAKIEEYLMGLGENEFAGAMAQRMETLDGALSNLGDEWDSVFRNITETGIGDYIEDQVRMAIDVLAEINAMLKSGELEGYLTAVGTKFRGYAADISQAIEIISKWYEQAKGTGSIAATILSEMKNLPENIRFFIQAMVIEILAGYDKVKAYSIAFIDGIKAIFDDSTLEDVTATLNTQLEIINQTRESSIQTIADERQAAISASEAEIAAAKQLRAEYDQVQASKKAASTGIDRLAGFKAVTATGDTGKSATEEKAEKARKKAFDKLQTDLRSEEEVIQESYNRRLEIIVANTEENSEKRSELIKKLNEQYKEDVMGDLDSPDTYQEQLDELEEYYTKRRELILENTNLTEEERTELEEELTRQRNERLETLETARRAVILEGASSLFGALADITGEFAGKQSGIYKTMFGISKAFAIAESLVKIQQGIANAASLPFPANLGAMATVATSTAGIVSTIKSVKLQGQAHDGMTSIPNEGTWNLAGGERIVAQEQNRDLTNFLDRQKKSGNTSGGNVIDFNVNVINKMDANVSVTAERTGPNEMQVIIETMENKLRRDLQEGRGVWNEAQKRYGWGTRGAF